MLWLSPAVGVPPPKSYLALSFVQDSEFISITCYFQCKGFPILIQFLSYSCFPQCGFNSIYCNKNNNNNKKLIKPQYAIILVEKLNWPIDL